MRSDQAKTIAINEYLEYVEGLKPTKVGQGGRELWYNSPIRKGDSTPSFKVDTILNLWFDHGMVKGGKIIDLVCEIRSVSVREALAILDNSGLYQGGYSSNSYLGRTTTSLFNSGNQVQEKRKSASEKEKVLNSSGHILLDVKDLSHPALLEYLENRKIDVTIAKQYVREIHYKPADKLVEYYALGWSNGEGYDIRNKYFKGFIGKGKTPSLINPKKGNDLIVFEGFIDFLSYLTHLKIEKGIQELKISVVVLNSTALRKQLLKLVSQYHFKKIYFFLDNDESGESTLDFYKEALQKTELIDMSSMYSSHKDFNEMLCNQ